MDAQDIIATLKQNEAALRVRGVVMIGLPSDQQRTRLSRPN